MPTNKHTEYLVALGSMDRNTTRRAFVHLGRYHGFDSISSAGGLVVNIIHNETLDYINNANAAISVAVFVTGHGIVVTTDVEPQVTVQDNSSGSTKYQILYAQYTWADSPAGSSVSYGIGSQLSGEPTTPTGMTNVQTALGYFTVPDGAVYADLIYTPYSVPNLAGKADIDLSGYAQLAEVNKFTSLNVWNEVALPKTAMVVDSGLGGIPNYSLELPENANLFTIEPLDSLEYKVANIIFQGSRTAQDGEIFYLYFQPSGATLSWEYGNIVVPGTYKALALNAGALFTFARFNGNYHVIGLPTTFMFHLTSLSNRIATNEAELQVHAAALAAMGSSSSWAEVIAPGTVVGNWTIDQLERSTLNGLLYVRGKFTGTPAALVAPATTNLGTTTLEADATLLVPHHDSSAPIHLADILLRFESPTDTVYILNPTAVVIGSAIQFILPPTPIS